MKSYVSPYIALLKQAVSNFFFLKLVSLITMLGAGLIYFSMLHFFIQHFFQIQRQMLSLYIFPNRKKIVIRN